MRLRKGDDLCLVHLVHGIGDFGRILLARKAVKEVAKEEQSTREGEKTYEDEHGGWPSRGTPPSMYVTVLSRNERFGLAGETKLAFAQVKFRHNLPNQTWELLLHDFFYRASKVVNVGLGRSDRLRNRGRVIVRKRFLCQGCGYSASYLGIGLGS